LESHPEHRRWYRSEAGHTKPLAWVGPAAFSLRMLGRLVDRLPVYGS
jgi:hypothetical protein